jgi:hypothetical protein
LRDRHVHERFIRLRKRRDQFRVHGFAFEVNTRIERACGRVDGFNMIARAHSQDRKNLVRIAAADLDAVAFSEDPFDKEPRLTQV